jgi:Raf kinase inhibitor-like YbhB/YbcL family protein
MARTWLRLAPLLALAALAGCGGKDRAANPTNGEGSVENAALAKLSLTSSAFRDGQPIPARYTCDGAGQSPPLAWGEPPPGTKSFVLIVDDPDAPSGLFRHWGAYDMPGSARSIAEGQAVGNQAINGFGKAGYGGPCPPRGNAPHHYRFKLYALDVDRLGLPPAATIEQAESEAQKHVLARAELIGTYERK